MDIFYTANPWLPEAPLHRGGVVFASGGGGYNENMHRRSAMQLEMSSFHECAIAPCVAPCVFNCFHTCVLASYANRIA